MSVLEWFKADAGRLPHRFHFNFDRKLISGNSLRWILSNFSKIIADLAGHQYLNGLAERTWPGIIQMAQAIITEKQFGQEFWYFAVRHAAMMVNKVLSRLGHKLTTPFELVHNSKPDFKTWIELFYVGYFNHDTDTADSHFKLQTHTLDGIFVVQYSSSNSIVFYNPITFSYYYPTDFSIDKSRLPITNFPNSLIFDGGLTFGQLINKTDPIYEPFSLGTRVSIHHNDIPTCDTIKNIPIPVSPILRTAASLST